MLQIINMEGHIMALTEAQRRAKQKYEKNLKRIQVTFYGTESDLFEYLETKDNKAGFIKQLIREAMEKEHFTSSEKEE